MKQTPETVSASQADMSPRNSKLREYANRPMLELARTIHRIFPKLTPNEITYLGSLGLVGLVLYTARLEKAGKIDAATGKKLVGFFLSLSATDLLDGSLARYLQSIGVEYTGKEFGPEVDSTNDRIQEAFSAWLALYRAAQQNDKLWLVTATLTALTNPLSSLFRAYAEKNGIAVPESGKNPFEFLGTRAGRFSTSILRYLPRIPVGSTSLQGIVDGLTTLATTKTTVSRATAVIEARSTDANQRGATHLLDEKLVKDAERRFNLLAGLAVITTSITGIILFKTLRAHSGYQSRNLK